MTPRTLRLSTATPAATAPAPKYSPLGVDIEPLLRWSDLRRVLVASQRTLDRLRASGKLPRPDLLIGRSPRWKAETIRRWIDTQS
jgi:predicted DNA-binding transcriptional regulator AlpA